MASNRVSKKTNKAPRNMPAGPPRRSARQVTIAEKAADPMNKSPAESDHVAPVLQPTPYVDCSGDDIDYDEDTATPGPGPHSSRPLPALAPPKKLPSKKAPGKKVEASRITKSTPKKSPAKAQIPALNSKKTVPKRKRYSEKVFWNIQEEAALARAYIKHIPYARIVRDILPERTSGSCKTKVRDMKGELIILMWRKGIAAGTWQYDPGMHAFQRGLPHQNVTKDSFKEVWDRVFNSPYYVT
ncbi:hypothetical protein BCR34DRAFT_604732 [Clohesyomyces aquaticus]|uniref:Uncharacterized protein n=1 Tax=Clohesyomyces aquaticus TaxID=1231657 RepID=A0A1Y1Z3S5_9PLEO|nr:hypothetical protein BCR34DRAFT_604732 [Clohesyomyces aquaticus]